MLTFILLFIVALVVSTIIVFKNYTEDSLKHKILYSIGFAFMPGAFAWALLGVVISVAILGNYNVETKLEHEIPIVSLKNTTGLSGSFTLGCGYINDVEYYHAFAKTANGDFYRIRVPVLKSIIRESTDATPNLKQYDYYAKENAWKPFTIPNRGGTESYILTVPTGTLIQQFKVE